MTPDRHTFDQTPKGIDYIREITLPAIKDALENGKPIEISPEDIANLRQTYAEAGFDLRPSIEVESSLTALQFRARVKVNENNEVIGIQINDRRKEKGDRYVDFDENAEYEVKMFMEEGEIVDKTYALFRILGTQKFSALIKTSYEIGRSYGHSKVGSDEATRGRGVQQVAANLVALAILDEEGVKGAKASINKSLWRGFDNLRKTDVDETFKDIGEKPSSKTAGVDPNAVVDILNFLTLQN